MASELSAECVHISVSGAAGLEYGHMELILAWFLINICVCGDGKWIFLSQAFRPKLIVKNTGSSFVLAQILEWKSCHGNPRFLSGSWAQPRLCTQPVGWELGWLSCFAVDLHWDLVQVKPGTCPVVGNSASFFGVGVEAAQFNVLWSARFMKTLFRKHSCVPSAFSTSDKKLYNPELFIGW